MAKFAEAGLGKRPDVNVSFEGYTMQVITDAIVRKYRSEGYDLGRGGLQQTGTSDFIVLRKGRDGAIGANLTCLSDAVRVTINDQSLNLEAN